MAEDSDPGKPRYTRYRATRRWPPRRSGGDIHAQLAELRALREDAQPAGEPRRRRLWRRGRRPRWLRVVWGLTALLGAWIGLSIVLFIASSLSASGIPAAALAQLDGAGVPVLSSSTTLVLGSDQRPANSKEPGADPAGPSRSDVIMLIRAGAGHSSRLSIPRDTVVSIPGHGLAKINAAYAYGGPALAIETVKRFLHIKINHLILINFTNFPKLVNAMGGVDFTGGCVVSFISGGFRNGGFTLRLAPGTHHLDGAQALALARTRENACNPAEDDLTRERRQQELFLDMKSQMLSLSGLIRLPWISWAIPRTIETDMSAPALAAMMVSLELGGSAHTALLTPTGNDELPDGESGLAVSDTARRAAVARFLAG